MDKIAHAQTTVCIVNAEGKSHWVSSLEVSAGVVPELGRGAIYEIVGLSFEDGDGELNETQVILTNEDAKKLARLILAMAGEFG